MAYKKNIICLANSTKLGGYCIAGKETVNGEYLQWIRPVSDRGAGEISEEEQKFSDGACPQLLDIISITLREPQLHKHKYQTENHLIDSGVDWEKQSVETWGKLEQIKDKPSELWLNGCSSEKGENDRIPITEAEGLKNSLFLIHVQSMDFRVERTYNGKKQARALFTYNECGYNLAITDPKAESYFFKREDLNENPISQQTLVERRIEARDEWEELKEEKFFLMKRIQGITKQAGLKYAQYKSSEYSNSYKLKDEAVKLYEEVERLAKQPDELDKKIITAKEKWDKLKKTGSKTEPKAESYFLKKVNRKYPLHNLYLCISLSEPFNDYYYKLAAGVIGKDLPY